MDKTGRKQPRRHKTTVSVFGFQRMSREEALSKIRTLLRRSPANPSALRLMSLFNIQPEELTEVGVPYEVVRYLDRQYRFHL
jgi:hypothetical protein